MQIIDVEQNTEEWLELRKRKILGSRVYSILASKTGTKEEIIQALYEADIEYPVNSKGKPVGTKDVFEALMTPEVEAKLMARAEKKLEFYELLGEYLAIDTKYEYDENDEIVFNNRTMMDRGHELEDEAAQKFTERTGKLLYQVGICLRDDNDRIGNSPDRLIKKTEKSKKYTEALEIKCLKTSKHLQALIEKKIPEEYFSQAVQYFVVNDDLQVLYFGFYDPRIPYECGFHYIEIHRTDPTVAKRIPQYLAYESLLLDEVDKWVERLAF